MWKIYLLEDDEIEAPEIRFSQKGNFLILSAFAKIKKSYDKKVGWLWWKNVKTITTTTEEKYDFCAVPIHQIESIWWEEKTHKKEVTMNPAVDMLINAVLAAIFAVMKAQGLSEEEAKAELALKIAQIEALAPLPMDV